MKNPCKECLVNSMCKDWCNDLVVYLKNKIPPKYAKEGYHRLLARAIRKGWATLHNNDTEWKGSTRSYDDEQRLDDV